MVCQINDNNVWRGLDRGVQRAKSGETLTEGLHRLLLTTTLDVDLLWWKSHIVTRG